MKAGAAGAPASDQAAFEQQGIEAPKTVSSGAGDPSAIDAAELGTAIGEAQEASADTLARLEHRGSAPAPDRAASDSAPVALSNSAPSTGVEIDLPQSAEPASVEPVPVESPASKEVVTFGPGIESAARKDDGREQESGGRGPEGGRKKSPSGRAVDELVEKAEPKVARPAPPARPTGETGPTTETRPTGQTRAPALATPAEEKPPAHDLDGAKAFKGTGGSETTASETGEVGGVSDGSQRAEGKEADRDGKYKQNKDPASRAGEDLLGADTLRLLLPGGTAEARTGKLLVQGKEGKLEPMAPRAVRVIAYVQGSRARTIVDFVFENPYDARLEGTFFNPLPADASPAGFAMFDGTKRIESESYFQSADLLPDLGDKMLDPTSFSELAPAKGKKIDWGKRKEARVVEQKRAREVYEDIVRHDVDPALLEWAGGGNFSARVFPIEPKSLKRIVVAYEQPLVFDGERFHYAYVLPAARTLTEVDGVLFVDQEIGRIAAEPPNAKASKAGRYTRFDLLHAPGAVMSCAVETKSSNVVLRGRDRTGLPGDTFYAELRPFVPTNGAELPTERALIFVDTSLSSAEGGGAERRARMLEALLTRDDTIKEYAVALFDLRVRWVSEIGWRANNAQNRAETMEQLRRVFLEGATSFSAVLSELERQRGWAVEGGKTTAFLLSDGEITWGTDKLELLAARHPVLRDVRWISYRFGDAPANQALFDLLNGETGGRTVTVLSEEEIGNAAVAHRLAPSELVSIEVRGAPHADLVIAGAPKQIFPGQTLRVAGRLPKGGAATLSVAIKTALSLDRVEVPLGNEKSDDSFAPRAWAELYARKLVELDDAKLDRLVVALSQHYRLANARASFLVLEREDQAEQYALRDENIDLAGLEIARKREEDQRRDRLLGIGLDEVAPENREIVEMIKRRADGVMPVLKPQPLVDAPFAGGAERLIAEMLYRKTVRASGAGEVDFPAYDRIARMRALSGDTAGAVRALSSVVEVRPRDGESMRLVGYALLALAQYEVAGELFERLRLVRPFEPEAYLEEALALDALGKVDQAARNYEIVLARPWPRHGEESAAVARWHYARLLAAFSENAKLSPHERARIDQRRKEIAPGKVDFQLSTFWSTDSVDIDLWIYEPNGEKCDYSHRETSLGGKLYFDVTDGLGPELYHAEATRPGQYDTLVHFFGSRAPRLAAPTAMLLVVDRGVLTPGGARSRKFQMRMLPKKDAVLMMRTDIFE